MGCLQCILEKNWEVIDDSVASGELLHHLRTGTKKQTTEMLGFSVGEQNLDGGAVSVSAGSPDSIVDNVELETNDLIFDRLRFEGCEDHTSLFTTILGCEPSRRFWEAQSEAKHNESEDQLEGDREPPCEFGRAVKAAEVNPVCNQRSDGNTTTLDADDLTTVVAFGAFGLVGGNGRGVDSVANTGEETANDELSGCANTLANPALGSRHCCDLDDDTDDHGPGSDEDSFATTEPVTELQNEACAEETSDSVDGNDETFPALVFGVLVDLRETVSEGLGRDDSRHDTLVVTKEQEVGDCNSRDKHLEPSSRGAPVGRHPAIGNLDAHVCGDSE